MTVLFFLGSPTQLVKLWWGERSCSEYLLPERSLGTYTRNLPAKIKGEVRFASVAKQFPKEADEIIVPLRLRALRRRSRERSVALQILPPHARHCLVILRNTHTCAYIAKRTLRCPFCFVYTSFPLSFHACPLPSIQDMSLLIASLLFFLCSVSLRKIKGGKALFFF